MNELTKTFGLNIIVGTGEADVLERCLKSVDGIEFDEIVVTHATKHPDAKVLEVAKKYATKVCHFVWCEDFSAARNYSFDQSEAKHIMWLDADDVIDKEEHGKINALIAKFHELDVVMMQYIYNHDDQSRDALSLPRERIVKNDPKIRWHDPCHEYLHFLEPGLRVARTNIKVQHYRTKEFDPQRNIRIMKREFDKGKASPRLKFYYGKELADGGSWDLAVPILEDLVRSGEGFRDNLVVACIRLTHHYFNSNDVANAKTYSALGKRYNPVYAECDCGLGMCAEIEGHIDEAIEHYKTAYGQVFGSGGMTQIADYYKYIPSVKLALIYLNRNEYSEARNWIDRALKEKPESKEALQFKSLIDAALKTKPGETVPADDISVITKACDKLGYTLKIIENSADRCAVELAKTRPLSVAWLLCSSDPVNPSTRLRRLLISEKLRELGHKSKDILYGGMQLEQVLDQIGDAELVVFTMFSEQDHNLMKALHARGKKVAMDHCEGIFDYPFENECQKEADVILCCSTALEYMTHVHGHKNTVVLKDVIEDRQARTALEYRDIDRPVAGFFGMGGNSFLVTDFLRETIEKAGYDLFVCTEWDNATEKWDPKKWPDQMAKCDVILCPQRVDVQPGKSHVKATTAMALGLPVICSPLQAYKEVVTNGKTGYIAETLEEWGAALKELKDYKVRRKIGRAGQKAVKQYHIDSYIGTYIQTFSDIINGKIQFASQQADVTPSNQQEAVDIIIPVYSGLEYLKQCLTSVRMNTMHPHHIIISDAGSGHDVWEYLSTLKGITVLGEEGKRLNFSQACNAGIANSASRFFVILNSDTIVSKGWLREIVKQMNTQNRLASCGVLSNCDRGWLHGAAGKPVYPMTLAGGLELIPGMKIEQVTPVLDSLYKFMEEQNKANADKFIPQPWVAAYATCYARSAISEVGTFDEQYQNGCEDLDLAKRLTASGFTCGQAIGSWVFHYGGISRGAYQSEGRTHYDEEDKANHVKFKTKWEKKRVAIYTGPAWEAWNYDTVMKGMAGSETWAAMLAREFTKRGIETTIYGDTRTTEVVNDSLGVRYVDHTVMENDLKWTYYDGFISSRTCEPLKKSLHAGKHFVMIHDIWLSPDPNYDTVAWKCGGYGYLSNWHHEFLLAHHKRIPVQKMFLTANGVDTMLYKPYGGGEKTNSTVYSSSPDRGLWQLLQMLPAIRAEVKDFTVHVCYGFHNWLSRAEARGEKESIAFIADIKELMKQDGVVDHGRVSKQDLARLQKQAKVWCFPTWFSETFCIGAIENGMAFNPIISTDYAGLQTTVGESGILLPNDNLSMRNQYPQEYCDRFVAETVKCLTDEAYRKLWAERALDNSQKYTWDKIADDWIKRMGL